jgi:hypothetical protein
LRESIAKDLAQGQVEHSPTRELLNQCVPLNGIIHMTGADSYPRDWSSMPVENCMAPRATNKYDDDNLKIKSSSKGEKFEVADEPAENHSCAAAPRERKETADQDISLVLAAYEKATGNRWNKSDSEAYHQNGIGNVSVDKTISALEAVVRRTPTKNQQF